MSQVGVTVRGCRLLGTLGSVLLAAGSWSAGALPFGVPDGVWAPRSPAYTVLGAAASYAGLVLLVVAWWRLGGLLRAGEPVGRGRMRSVLWSWVLPLVPGPVIFSNDAYSYVAQGALAVRGWDVYRLGPSVLGGPLADNVPEVWQDAPAPYGPVAVSATRAVVALTGEHHTVAAVLGMRLLALFGLALIVWSVGRLASDWASGRGSGPCSGSGDAAAAGALWAAVLNPLALVHLVGGAHNEALMIGLMVAGLVAFRRGHWVLGTVVLVSAALVKVPAAVALLCAAAWSVGGRPDRRAGWLRAAGIALVGLAALVLGVAVCGQGWGWLSTLRGPAQVYTVLSPSTDVGRVLGLLSEGFGVGTAGGAIAAARSVGLVLGVCLVGFCVGRAPRTGPEYAAGMALLGLVVTAPVVQPWYVLWGIVPLASVAWRLLETTGVRLVMLVLLFMVLPSGTSATWSYGVAAVTGASAALAALVAWGPPVLGTLPRLRLQERARVRAAVRTRR
ncbi:polyprenol phosphomannose-dependent alpha 1,6 mannosyltransferase MptB [Streptomyces flavotricini]|uniref:Polyprenol phosphomannose-dependent alpha 1,6 mannosyltransferase MptB n=1 Tax=Streptomyces flavotricini TaxID=66888 RepID=A0ABS8DYP9_9ACTN|nr:polyprenol phosphomannose-dependent alpha 1,6 mannosyltransferase MptB [Streptomyces flavotricini]MCC0093838.1 polyprenol phosphomannose-dependent alpha 1,6 mannosyltransferase MptB [Streptomyces flavotricini]